MRPSAAGGRSHNPNEELGDYLKVNPFIRINLCDGRNVDINLFQVSVIDWDNYAITMSGGEPILGLDKAGWDQFRNIFELWERDLRSAT
jgi:hypothetical protein